MGRELWSGFRQGLREGPVLFFLPLIVAWRIVSREVEAVMAEMEEGADFPGSRAD